MTWLEFARHSRRRFYLFDTWSGIPTQQVSAAEKHLGILEMNRKYQNGDSRFSEAQLKFSQWPNAVLIRGRVPESLSALNDSARIAYASIDLNVAEAEMGAIDVIWPKMTNGGLVLIDDYGWASHANQKRAWDEWAHRTGVMILALPTGQALVRKPCADA